VDVGADRDPADTDPADGTEPDARFTLANERTFLAWVRTSLGLLAAGVAVVQFAPDLGISGARTAAGLTFVVLAVLSAVGGLLRWRAVDAAMRHEAPLPALRLPWVLVAGLVLLGVLFGVGVVAGR